MTETLVLAIGLKHLGIWVGPNKVLALVDRVAIFSIRACLSTENMRRSLFDLNEVTH